MFCDKPAPNTALTAHTLWKHVNTQSHYSAHVNHLNYLSGNFTSAHTIQLLFYFLLHFLVWHWLTKLCSRCLILQHIVCVLYCVLHPEPRPLAEPSFSMPHVIPTLRGTGTASGFHIVNIYFHYCKNCISFYFTILWSFHLITWLTGLSLVDL